jgi:tetratricopeptide (TPR) repeat protein
MTDASSSRPQAAPALDLVRDAKALFRQGRLSEARAMLAPALADDRGGSDAHHLMGVILHGLGEASDAELALRTAVRLAPGATGPVEALTLLLEEEGRPEEAVGVQAGLVQRSGGHPLAELGLAKVLLRVGRDSEAEAACRRALERGAPGGEPWILLGRIQFGQARLEAAEEAFRTAVARDPPSADAHRELSELIWVRTGDVDRACATLNAAPPSPALTSVAARLLESAGQEAAAFALVCSRAERDPSLNVLAARLGLRIDPRQAERRLSAAPASVDPLILAKARSEVDLALGRADRAARRALALHDDHPDDHYATALLAAAWRLSGDPRYRALYDYDRLVGAYRIEAPAPWTDLDAYLADLAEALDQVHAGLAHPPGQSLRGGSQTVRDLTTYRHPAIRGLFAAVDAPIRRHIAALGESVAAYRFVGAWSVRLNCEGLHIDHIHPEGWLSSAFYVRVPEGEGREGWLTFGQPGPPTSPPLAPDHFVRPEPGGLVLFPSYMWHGTLPFHAHGTRLTCAFDVAPRARRGTPARP